MISFFRKIRQKLLAQNRLTRYLTYAIGEILLVTIGILIALQINTWNEQRLNQKKEKSILESLQLEFLNNREKLQVIIQHHEAILGTTRDLMKLFNEPESVLKNYNLDSLIERSIDFRSYNPSQSVIEDLISSGNLDLISSETMRKLIFEWGTETLQKVENYNTLDETSQFLLIPYLMKKTSLKNIDRYGFLKWEEKSKFKSEPYKLFLDLEFENQLDNYAWGIVNYLQSLYILEEITDKIISETNQVLLPEQ
ncbi:hypothetical protein JYB62_13225 [Algoriphagus lutimaris]|uniref:DUF6090 family protein n=1 Tax=Algoriphagus lutimaris TaxID=613197 RepID=UPI00196A6512|nr:DUF6090 family protein [Algoriphagus lutimaris]MBN3520964.1 hypothetical protein [Algoriphagus lutimaris]